MATRNTGTSLTDSAGNNATFTHLSTNIIVKVNGQSVGAIKSLDINESRSIALIAEVGTDGIIDSTPNRSTEISGSCSRTRFARMRIAEAFQQGFVHVHAQRIPFDIEIQDIFADPDPGNAIITTLKNVWIQEIRTKYNAEDFVIVDDMTWKCERIYSVLNNKNVVSATASGRNVPIIIDQFSAQADRGLYSGSLDAAGLLNAFISDPRGA